MKKKKIKVKKYIKNKKLLVFLTVSLFTFIGGTLAYFTTSTTFKNIFNTGKYETQIVEDFESPTNWIPGTTTNKKVTVTNNGTIDMTARGAKGAGENVYLYKNSDDTYEYVPEVGAEGGEGVRSTIRNGRVSGNDGKKGVLRQTRRRRFR